MMCRYQSTRRLVRRQNGQVGFTLVEACISIVLMAMLLLGAIDLFVSALRNATNATALIFANDDAATALQSVEESTREAYYFQLPDEASFTAPNGYTASNYETTMTYSGSTETICTGMLVQMPNKSGTFSVSLDNGSAASPAPSVYSRDQGVNGITPGQQILYYRSDSNGTPDPTAGTCLWALTISDADGSQPTYNQPIIKTIAPNLSNAVQFLRPQSAPNGQGVTTSIPYEVEIKVICSYYAPTGGDATNEVSNGEQTTSLDGRCVFMRDHELSATYENGSTSPVNNKFLP